MNYSNDKIKQEEIKDDLVNHLKTLNYIDNVYSLWGESKNYMSNKYGEMGGAFASFGKDITVTVKCEDELYRFTVTLKEII